MRRRDSASSRRMAPSLSSAVSTRPRTCARPKRRRSRGSQSDRAKKPSPPWLSTSATHAARDAGVLEEAQRLRGARGRAEERRAEGRLLAEEVAVALPEEGLVEGVVAATRAGGHEAGELGPRVDARVEEGVALEVEEARPGEGLDLLPGEQRPLAVFPLEDGRSLGSARLRRPPRSAPPAPGGRGRGRARGRRRPSCRASGAAAPPRSRPSRARRRRSGRRRGPGAPARSRITATYSSAERVT